MDHISKDFLVPVIFTVNDLEFNGTFHLTMFNIIYEIFNFFLENIYY